MKPEVAAQTILSVGMVGLSGAAETRSGRDTRQPNRVLANAIARNNAEWWPGAGEVRLAAAQHERAEVETIFVDKTEVGEARGQRRPRDVDFTLDVLLESRDKRVDVLRDECGVRAD